MTTLEIALLQWDANTKRTLKTLESFNEENFHRQIVANGNSPSWLFGHLADTDDMLLELFGIRARLYPELKTIYHHERGSNLSNHLTRQELISKWKAIIAELDNAFKGINENDWLGRHMAVTEDEFQKEPQRNKLNVLLSRVTHKAYHLGQIALLAK
jgi:uncharacterized damage-inducible protein DinB